MNHHHHHHHNNKSKPSISSQIDVEGTLRAATSRHSQNPNALSAGKQWYDKLPAGEQTQIQLGIEALLYAGCMAAARRTFDTVVRQEMASAAAAATI
mmetsp:Transcript_7502/g.13491  ORF Transcript_7502/g.13491 Transcript_7502/m.13491 type:complete len:97 (-) Transcript_7502:3110-3400(-)